jgi:hypothetical protein
MEQAIRPGVPRLPSRRSLFGMAASSAIPGAFPPTKFEVTVDGKPYQQMHVDGGALAQAFLYPDAMAGERRAGIASGQTVVPATAYVPATAASTLNGRPLRVGR